MLLVPMSALGDVVVVVVIVAVVVDLVDICLLRWSLWHSDCWPRRWRR